jgi:hypothetical protein
MGGRPEQELHFTNHALERLEERGISVDDVRFCLARRFGTPSAGQPGTMWIRGFTEGGRILKVCVRADDSMYVITAVWAREDG